MKGRTETTMTKATQVALIVRKRTQLLAKLRAEAKRQGVTALNAQHQFAFDMFLTRMFSHQECPWVLKGGTSLLLRLGSGRRSEDIDLARNTHLRPAEALQELKQLVNSPGPTDPDFSFVLKEPARDNQDPQDPTRGSVKVVMMLGGNQFVQFSVDLSTQQHLDCPVDQVPITPIITHDSLPSGAVVSMVAVESVVADKLCACYEYHQVTGASTRFHDLIDLVRIVTAHPLDAERLRTLISREVHKRSMVVLPKRIQVPGVKWEDGYPKQAANAADFPRDYQDLHTALAIVRECLDDVLAGKDISGTWNPHLRRWEN